MRSPVALPLFIAILLSQPAAAQVRPAGTNSSVTTGIGSSSSVTTHPPLPGTNTTTNATPIPGLFPYVPEDRDKSDQAGPAVEDLEHGKPKGAAKAAPRSEYQESNAIARDRVESPHDAAFNENNVFNAK